MASCRGAFWVFSHLSHYKGGGGQGVGFNNRKHVSFLLLKIVRELLSDVHLRVRKDVTLTFVVLNDTNYSVWTTQHIVCFLIVFFDKERTLLKDKGQKREKSNFNALEEKVEVFGISGNLLSGESGSNKSEKKDNEIQSGSETFVTCACLPV